jgi:hypothetical protein
MGRRLAALAVTTAAAAVLFVAAMLTPAAAGLGTHRQLRLPSCGWIAIFDLPCPTCGMTTAFAHAADGDFLASFRAQPMGFALALATTMTFLVGASITLTGSRLASVFSRFFSRRAAWLFAAGYLVAWVYKMLSYKGVL